ncbi:MAG: HAD family phosphatase [Candidatus Krumholzibacteria bacterium]|nr:HAD family phosphatase [Candidatus Krumholzibacteria bacterium]
MSSNTEVFRRIIDGAAAVIFDFDNVIVDSEPFHYKAYSEVFAGRGHTIDRDEYWVEWTSKGGGAEGEINRYGLDLDPADIRAEKDPVYSSYCVNGEIPLFPDAVRITELFRSSGIRTAIASGSYSHDVKALLTAHNIGHLFEIVVGKDDSGRIKPFPEPYLLAALRLDLEPERCFAIEDAEKGVISAHAAGMKVIVVDTEVTAGVTIPGADLHLPDLGGLYEMMVEAEMD